MHKSRYVVMQKDGEWQIKNAYRQNTSTFPSKTQALCAAIELAEKDGIAVMNRKFLSGMRTIVSSHNGCTAKTCIQTTQQDPLAESSQDEAAPNVANRTLRSGQND